MPVLDQNLLTLENSTGAPDTTGSAVRAALVADVLRGSGISFGNGVEDVGSFVRLRVYGESMLPTLWPGDIVEITSCSVADVRHGEIVLALHDGRLFLHRMVAATPGGFVLRGDSMPGPDPLFPSDALLGRLTSRRSRSVLSRVLGKVFCHCGPARRLALQLRQRGNRLLKDCPPFRSLTGAAKADVEGTPDIAAVNRCATQKQRRVFHQGAKASAGEIEEIQNPEPGIEVGSV